MGREFKPWSIPRRTFLEEDTILYLVAYLSECIPKYVINQVTWMEPVCLPIRYWYLLSVCAQLLRGLANRARYILIANPWYCTTRIPCLYF